MAEEKRQRAEGLKRNKRTSGGKWGAEKMDKVEALRLVAHQREPGTFVISELNCKGLFERESLLGVDTIKGIKSNIHTGSLCRARGTRKGKMR